MTRPCLGGIVLAALFAACTTTGPAATGANGAPSSEVATATSTPTPSPRVVARLYPYLLPWPEDELERKWRYASIPWDGETRIDHGNASTDSVRTRDGELFAFGFRTSKTAADLQAMTAEQATEWHGCDASPIDQAPLAADGEQGILAVHDCGGERVIRWFAAHDGFGLIVIIIAAPDADSDVVRSHFEEHIAQLTWTD